MKNRDWRSGAGKSNGANVPIIGAKVQPVTITIDIDETGKAGLKASRPVQPLELASFLIQIGLGQVNAMQKAAMDAAKGGAIATTESGEQ